MNREQIVEALASLNMNQSVIAKICGIPVSKLNRHLKGYVHLDDHELSRVTSTLRVCLQIESGHTRLADLMPVDWQRVVQKPALEAALFHGEQNV
jgi:predicted transcriptional regulator